VWDARGALGWVLIRCPESTDGARARRQMMQRMGGRESSSSPPTLFLSSSARTSTPGVWPDPPQGERAAGEPRRVSTAPAPRFRPPAGRGQARAGAAERRTRFQPAGARSSAADWVGVSSMTAISGKRGRQDAWTAKGCLGSGRPGRSKALSARSTGPPFPWAATCWQVVKR
jgi:hypothetical protein